MFWQRFPKTASRMLIVLSVLGGAPCGARAIELKPPETTDDGWKTAAPSEVGLSDGPLVALAEKLRTEKRWNLHSVLVVKDEKLVFEEYFTGMDECLGRPLGEVKFHRDQLHDLRSMTKSVSSAVLGIALSKKPDRGVHTTLAEWFPEHRKLLSSAKENITLQQVLTMTGGFEWDESLPYNDPDNSAIKMMRSGDPLRYLFNQPMAKEPGTHFEYCAGLSLLMGPIVEQITGKSIDRYAQEVLFGPLQIQSYEWHRYPGGLLHTSAGLRLRPRDMAKFGLLYLTGGHWRGRSILPKEWIKESIQPRSKPHWTVGYGYQWWIERFLTEAGALGSVTAIGLGGQRIFVVEELAMVVVMTGGHYYSYGEDPELLGFGEKLMRSHIFPAAEVKVVGFDRGEKPVQSGG
jgi:CubicO group peptidase (beta-lactamase class C family)